jgi:hypothetical protein
MKLAIIAALIASSSAFTIKVEVPAVVRGDGSLGGNEAVVNAVSCLSLVG